MHCLHELPNESHGTDEFEFHLHTGVNTRSIRSTVLGNSQGKGVSYIQCFRPLGMRYHHALRVVLHGIGGSEFHLHNVASTKTTLPKIRRNVRVGAHDKHNAPSKRMGRTLSRHDTNVGMYCTRTPMNNNLALCISGVVSTSHCWTMVAELVADVAEVAYLLFAQSDPTLTACLQSNFLWANYGPEVHRS